MSLLGYAKYDIGAETEAIDDVKLRIKMKKKKQKEEEKRKKQLAKPPF